jgi:hypothetical protein
MRRADDEPRLGTEGRRLVRWAGHELGQAEVEHLHIAVGSHHDVVWLDVTVRDAARMGGGQRAGDLHRHGDGLAYGQRAAVGTGPTTNHELPTTNCYGTGVESGFPCSATKVERRAAFVAPGLRPSCGTPLGM